MEIWRKLDIYDQYMISTCGNIRNRRTRIPITPTVNAKGELRVILRKGNLRYSLQVARLVLETFTETVKPEMDILYKDNNPSNVCLDNLAYCERNKSRAIKCDGHELRQRFGKKVRIVETGEIFDSIHECSKKTGLDRSNIIKCVNGTNRTCGGYSFELVES